MGYSTEFYGTLTVDPPLTAEQVKGFNDFCGKRHEDARGGDPAYSIWADWEVTQDGSRIRWNDSEKSYEMDRWLAWLIGTFCRGSKVNGTIDAEGEAQGDVWRITVTDSQVKISRGTVVWSD